MSTPEPHPITLEKVVFTRCIVIAVPGHEPGGDQPIATPENSIQLTKVADREGVFAATMKTLVNPNQEKSSPYSIDMECVAVVVADKTLSEADAQRGAMITAHNVLYGAIRETIAWLTGRQPYGGLLLGLSVLRTSPPPAQEQAKA